MANDPKYVLDANVFVEAARRYYAFDLGTRFWEKLSEAAGEGQVKSIDRVKAELERGKDELAEWARDEFADAFASTDEDRIVRVYSRIMSWVEDQDQFQDAAKAEFARSADGWLVAYAKARGWTVVTHEAPAPEARRKVPIPNVCLAFKVPFVDTFEMLRRLRIRLA